MSEQEKLKILKKYEIKIWILILFWEVEHELIKFFILNYTNIFALWQKKFG